MTKLDPQVRWALIAAVVGGVASGVVEVLVGADRAVFAATVAAVALAFAAWRLARLAFAKERSAVEVPRGKAPKQYVRGVAARIAVCALILMLVVAVAGWLVPRFYRYSRAAVSFRSLNPPELRLAVERRVVALGDMAQLRLLVDGRDAPEDYGCSWRPLESTLPGSPNCAAAFAPPPDMLSPSRRPRKVTVSVEVWKRQRKVASRSTTVRVVFAPAVTIEVGVEPPRDLTDDIFSGDTVRAVARLNGRDVPAGHSCSWTLGKRILERARCRIELVTPSVAPGQSTEALELRVLVVDDNRTRVGEETRRVTVYRPRPSFTVFVLEASRRSSAPSPFELARADLVRDLSKIREATGYVGIELFGAAHPHARGSDCLNAVPLVPLAPLDIALVDSRVRTVVSGTGLPPVQLALGRGLAALARVRARDPRATTRLVAILGGPDPCRGESLAQFLEDWQREIDTEGLQSAWFRFELLTLAVVVDFKGEMLKAWRRPDTESRYLDGAFVVLFAPRQAELVRIVDAVARLGALQAKARAQACRDLAVLAGKNEGPTSARRVESYCPRVY